MKPGRHAQAERLAAALARVRLEGSLEGLVLAPFFFEETPTGPRPMTDGKRVAPGSLFGVYSNGAADLFGPALSDAGMRRRREDVRTRFAALQHAGAELVARALEGPAEDPDRVEVFVFRLTGSPGAEIADQVKSQLERMHRERAD